MLAHHLRRWANISPVLSYRVVFGVALNVGSVTEGGPTLTQLLFKALCRYMLRKPTIDRAMCRCSMHQSDVGQLCTRWPTLERHWGYVYYVHALPPA